MVSNTGCSSDPAVPPTPLQQFLSCANVDDWADAQMESWASKIAGAADDKICGDCHAGQLGIAFFVHPEVQTSFDGALERDMTGYFVERVNLDGSEEVVAAHSLHEANAAGVHPEPYTYNPQDLFYQRLDQFFAATAARVDAGDCN